MFVQVGSQCFHKQVSLSNGIEGDRHRRQVNGTLNEWGHPSPGEGGCG